jgi:hypothetical protein
MLKAVSIKKKKSKDKNSSASNDSVIVEHEQVIQGKNRRILSRSDIDLANKATKNNFSPKILRSRSKK